ncbi:MAG: carbonic anhydrase [FCB group bacterium]|nr:carbonic anhydrase [FCB group bacterium]
MISPSAAIDRLKEGNQRFVTETSIFPNVSGDRRVETTHKKQTPFAAVLTCSDSRTPPEYIFDQGLGDLFVVRNAGNVCDNSVIASMELAVEHLHVPLIVIMGHRKCGAVEMAANNISISDNLNKLNHKIKPAIMQAKQDLPHASHAEFLEHASKLNTQNTLEEITDESSLIRKKLKEGVVEIKAAYYDIESGEVEWL